MNLILFDPDELDRPLPVDDPRARHILHVLKRRTGETIDAGVVNGARGKAIVAAITAGAVTLSFEATTPAAAPIPVTLIVGLPRPQTARDILRDATTLGVGALHFVRTEKGEPGYAQSTLWSSGEWRRQVRAGAEQAFDTRVPDVTHGRTLAEVLPAGAPSPAMPATRLALDNYESASRLADTAVERDAAVVLAIGSERGWSAAEREILRLRGFTFVHLGPRVLRAETAVIAALTLVHARRSAD